MRSKTLGLVFSVSASLLGACSIQEGSDSSSELFYPSAQMVFDKHAGHYPDGGQTRILGKEEIVVSGGTYGQPFVVNGKEVATPGYVMSLYIADFNEDGYSEFCLGCSLGSGWINESVFVYDYHNEKGLFTLSDRQSHDYYFGVLNGTDCLFVFEYKVMTTEPLLRQGRIGYCGCGEITVDWEEASTSSQESASSPLSHHMQTTVLIHSGLFFISNV